MNTIHWKVDGMTCSNCSLTVAKFLKDKGKKNVKVNAISGDVIFDNDSETDHQPIIQGIEGLGYKVTGAGETVTKTKKKYLSNHLQRFLFCAIFTLPLMLHMVERWWHIPFLMNPWVQLALCLPVYIVGMDFFGRSALKSIRNGLPNMNVLIAIGATAAFVYSLAGTFLDGGQNYLFYETAAAIITLVFLGNYLEDVSVRKTQTALDKLVKRQKVMANMIAFDDQHQELVFPIENDQLKTGDIILIKNGEQVPADSKILTGTASINESIVTGESLPVEKGPKDKLIGGSLVVDGILKAQVTSEAKDSVLARIVNLVHQMQGEKPPVQQLADKISAVFVPVVLVISAVTLIVNLVVLESFTPSLMRAIAVLVIACPCAMGLATPAAIAVGLGRAARNGILFRNSKTLELFRDIRQAVFDKTGTLTTGEFAINTYHTTMPDEEFRRVVYSLEKLSNHPIATSISREWKMRQEIRWSSFREIKGFGMQATTKDGTEYKAGSFRMVENLPDDKAHQVYVLRNNELVGWIDVSDQIRPEAFAVINYLKKKKIKTILLSGDGREACEYVAEKLGIDEVIPEQTPEQKLEKVSLLTSVAPTLMVGDGINDAPALARATIGISLSEASQIAMQTADVVLMNSGLNKLNLSVGIGKHTYLTIRQNLFWAFIYNIVAIPIAALGLLTPAFAALVMGFSDVVLAGNSLRLFVKKVV